MGVIRDSIESRANDVCRAKEELRKQPVYPYSAAYASGAWGNGTVQPLISGEQRLQRSH